MKVKIDTRGIRESKWYAYVLRFAFGGAITALAGMIAKRYGPAIGGLFLAFPAIFPATATLLADDEKKKKEHAGLDGTIRGRMVAGVDAAGAAMGAVGLVVFALIVWQRLPQSATVIVLGIAVVGWFITAIAVWEVRERLWRRWAQKMHASSRHLHPARRSPALINKRDFTNRRDR
jgi:hypothetical protein